MVKVEVVTSVVDTKQGVSAKTGKPYAIREQEAWAFFCGKDGKPHPHPQKIKITLEDEQTAPYSIGNYLIDPSSLYVGKFDQVNIRVRLKPRPVAAAAPAVPRAA